MEERVEGFPTCFEVVQDTFLPASGMFLGGVPCVMRAWLLVLLATAGCKDDKLKWKAQVLTSIQVGTLKFEIPKGWRDLSESADPQLANITRRLGADTEAHILVREDAKDTESNISFMLADLAGAPSCDQWAAAMDLQGGPKIDHSTLRERTYGAESGCSFHLTDGGTAGRMFLRFQPPKFVTLQCLRPGSGDANLDATCDRMAEALAQ